ncbi:MAG TPA: C1 family peptidase [Casimicrobiaceae bacterium]|nr:C1 family peptidase [Casimicrobiaceae bacterium]
MPKSKRSRPRAGTSVDRTLDARPDTLDFRDLLYTPTLVEVPPVRPLALYRKKKVPVQDQGSEGACTGFGLATVVHYLLRSRQVAPDTSDISPFMLYDMARRYDEWAGEDYSGSSCRGAMKGWQKHGACTFDLWRASGGGLLSERCVNDALRRPLGAYFRVNHRDLVSMHAAITEASILYVSANVHSGWLSVKRDGHIAPVDDTRGVHAFALVAYDAEGFWLQNSWGARWAHEGLAHLGYDDWLANGTDAWVARLGSPIELRTRLSTSKRVFAATARAKEWAYDEIRPHVISLGNDGVLETQGNIGTTAELVREIVRSDIPRITAGWKKKRILLYAHGGLVAEDGALHRIADYRKTMLDAEVYPLAFIWHSDAWSTIKDILQDAINRRRPEGIIDAAKDFVLDRIDDTLEPLSRAAGGATMWAQMKRNAIGATASTTGGARLVLDELATLARTDSSVELHIVAHSAGSIFHAAVVQYITGNGTITTGPLRGTKGLGLRIASCTLWAPAITTRLFNETYLPAANAGTLANLALFTLDDATEQDDDCANLYHKSLLYLVSNALDDTLHVPILHPNGEPLAGLAVCVDADPGLKALFGANGKAEWILAPNDAPEGSAVASRAKHHGEFDDDKPTLAATLARVLGVGKTGLDFTFQPSAQRKRAIRRNIDHAADFALTR